MGGAAAGDGGEDGVEPTFQTVDAPERGFGRRHAQIAGRGRIIQVAEEVGVAVGEGGNPRAAVGPGEVW